MSTLMTQMANSSILKAAALTAVNDLIQFGTDETFTDKMAGVFGGQLNTNVLLDLSQQWVSGNFSSLPQLEIRTAVELNGSNGAFAGATNTIYLSRELLDQNAANPSAITAVLLEEFGHFIDHRLNTVDTPGDEGELFSAVVRGISLSEEDRQAIRSDDDHAIVKLDGNPTEIEKADPEKFAGNLAQSDLIPGLTTVLDGMEKAITTLVEANELPFIGKKLSAIDAPIITEITNLKNQITQTLNGLGSKGVQEVRDGLFQLFNATSFLALEDFNKDGQVNINDIQVKESKNNVQFDLSIHNNIASFNPNIDFDFGLPGLGFKVDQGSKLQASLDFTDRLSFGIDFDSTNPTAPQNIFYLNTAPKDASGTVNPEIALDLNVSTPNLSGSGELGFLKFDVKDDSTNPSKFHGTFSLDLTDKQTGKPQIGDGNGKLTVAELSSAKLTDLVDADLEGLTQANLKLASNLGSDLLPSIKSDFNLNWTFKDTEETDVGKPVGGVNDTPSIAFNNVQIDLGEGISGFSHNVLGKIQEVTKPFQPIIDVLKNPIPVLDDFGKSFLDRTGDGRVSLVDVIKVASEVAVTAGLLESPPDLGFLDEIDRIAKLVDLVNSIPTGTDNIFIELGDFQVSGVDTRQSGTNLSAGTAKAGPAKAAIGEQLNHISQDPNSNAQKIKGFLEKLHSGDDSAPVNNLTSGSPVNSLVSNPAASLGKVGTAFGDINFPLLENPGTVFNLLLGKPVDLVTYDMPKLEFKVPFDAMFPIVGPLGVKLHGELGASADLDFGFDTEGLTQFANGGFKSPEQIFDGFFINDDKPDGTPKNEFEITAGIDAFAAVDAFLVSAGVGGGVHATIGADLHDFNDDGKVRVSELAKCLMDITGKLEVVLSAFISIGFPPLIFSRHFDIARATLLSFEFSTCGGEDDPKFNRDIVTNLPNSGGVYQLNIGPHAGERFLGDKPGTDIEETFAIRPSEDPNQPGISFAFSGVARTFNDVTQIVGNGGEENDAIILDAAITVSASLEGGNGNDQLFSGSGNDTLKGDAGDDAIEGGAGNDSIEGGSGNDFINGGLGADLIDGGSDSDAVSYETSEAAITIKRQADNSLKGTGGEAEGDVLKNIEQITGTNLADSIEGNDQANTLEGLDGNDTLNGGEGDDLLIGGSGADSLIGGNGNDSTSYITSNGQVQINLATGKATGGDAQGDVLVSIENVQGSIHDDVLIGNSANNQLDGSFGNDQITGGAGADTLDGGGIVTTDRSKIGSDWVKYNTSASAVNVSLKEGKGNPFIFFGGGGDGVGDVLKRAKDETGNETVFSSFENLQGSAFNDSLEGDAGANIIEGLAGDDTLKGDAGNDTLRGGIGKDSLDGGKGIDWADYSQSKDKVVISLVPLTFVPSEDVFAKDSQGFSTVENILGSDFADTLFGDGGNNEINPGLSSGSGTNRKDAVSGGGGIDRLTLDYSVNDNGLGVTGGFFGGFGTLGSLSRKESFDSNTVLDQVDFDLIEQLTITGTSQNDSVVGGAGDDVFLMGGGNDTVVGGRGNNVIRLDDGNDEVTDQNEPDLKFSNASVKNLINLDGGAGIDTLSVNLIGKGAIVLESKPLVGASGSFQEDPNQKFVTADGTVSITNFEKFKNIATGDGNDKLTQFGKVNNVFSTGLGSDTVNAGLGFDTVDGGGNPFPVPKLVPDTPAALADLAANNNDLLIVDYSVDDFSFNGGMTSAVSSQLDADGLTSSGFFERKASVGSGAVDRILFSNFERFQLTGTSKDDQITAGDNNDTLTGGAGNDTLRGNDGSDQLFGGAGNDTLIGTALGGNGQDTLTGGAGVDTFVLGDIQNFFYNKHLGSDAAIIQDFKKGEDFIQLHGLKSQATSNYTLQVSGGITSILQKTSSGLDLLANVVTGTNSANQLNLNDSYFVYVT